MEKREIQIECMANFSRLPEQLSGEKIPEEKRPSLDDWKYLQGGKPEIVPYIRDKSGKILSYEVIHRYENPEDSFGTGAVVTTSCFLVKRWENPYVSRKINGREVLFPVALVWQYHGKPCLVRSGLNSERKVVKVER